MTAVGVRKGDMRWPAVGGTCGRTVAWGHGGLRRAHAGEVLVVPLVLVHVVVVLCAVDGAQAGGGSCAGFQVVEEALRLVVQEFEEVGLVCRG